MEITASDLRQNIYRLLDEVLETGVPLEVMRGRRLLRIMPRRRPREVVAIVRSPRDNFW
jgi:hypothetical protein